MNVGRISRKLDFVLARQSHELFAFGDAANIVQDALLQFTEPLQSTYRCWIRSTGLPGNAQIHRRHRKLQAATTLQKQDGVVLRDRTELAESLFGASSNALKFR